MTRLEKDLKTIIRKRLEFVAAGGFQDIGPTPRLYLHARADREAVWRETRERLEEGGFSVEPSQLKQIGNSLLEVRRAQRDRLEKLATCHGLLVLCSHPADDISADIEACQADRDDVEAARGRFLPCAVLDLTSGDMPKAAAFAMEVLPGHGRGWLQNVRAWLHERIAEAPRHVS